MEIFYYLFSFKLGTKLNTEFEMEIFQENYTRPHVLKYKNVEQIKILQEEQEKLFLEVWLMAHSQRNGVKKWFCSRGVYLIQS